MGKTITLAVDTARDEPGKHVAAAVDVAKELGHARDEATVPHVHEFAVGKFDRQGERLLSDIVHRCRSRPVRNLRHCDDQGGAGGPRGPAILATATQQGARVLVLSSRRCMKVVIAADCRS